MQTPILKLKFEKKKPAQTCLRRWNKLVN